MNFTYLDHMNNTKGRLAEQFAQDNISEEDISLSLMYFYGLELLAKTPKDFTAIREKLAEACDHCAEKRLTLALSLLTEAQTDIIGCDAFPDAKDFISGALSYSFQIKAEIVPQSMPSAVQ